MPEHSTLDSQFLCKRGGTCVPQEAPLPSKIFKCPDGRAIVPASYSEDLFIHYLCSEVRLSNPNVCKTSSMSSHSVTKFSSIMVSTTIRFIIVLRSPLERAA